MIRTALAILATCTAAHAGPVHHWGGSNATLSARPGVPLAYVDFTNRLTNSLPDLAFTLDLGGFEVEVIVTNTPGRLPDTYQVIPPEGYIAIPQILEVEEDGTGRVAIYRMDGVGA